MRCINLLGVKADLARCSARNCEVLLKKGRRVERKVRQKMSRANSAFT